MSPRIHTLGMKTLFQIILESKEDDSGNCRIDFKIIKDDTVVVNEQSETQKCQTYGVKNQLILGSNWDEWEGWVQ